MNKMNSYKVRKRVPSIMVPVLNRSEIVKSFKTKSALDNFNLLMEESTVLLQNLPLTQALPIILNKGLSIYVKQKRVKKVHIVSISEAIQLFLVHSATTVTPLEQRKRTIFFTEVLPTYWKALKLPSDTSLITSSHLYKLSNYMGIQPNRKQPELSNTPQTVNRYIKMIKNLINWGNNTGSYSMPNTMPTLKIKDSQVAHRTPLNGTDIQLIQNNLYSSSLILFNTMLLSGMRNSEVGRCVVTTIDNIPVFNLRESEQVKTSSSRRIIPIHPTLLPYIDTILGWTEQDIKRISRSINITIKELLPNTHHTLYECRHTFISTLLNNNVPLLRVQQLSGHSQGSITIGTYFGGFSLDTLYADICTIL